MKLYIAIFLAVLMLGCTSKSSTNTSTQVKNEIVKQQEEIFFISDIVNSTENNEIYLEVLNTPCGDDNDTTIFHRSVKFAAKDIGLDAIYAGGGTYKTENGTYKVIIMWFDPKTQDLIHHDLIYNNTSKEIRSGNSKSWSLISIC